MKHKILPPKDFIITGIPRSGTTFLNYLLNSSSNCVCFNEIFYNVNLLPAEYSKLKWKIRFNKKVPQRVNIRNEKITDTRNDSTKIVQEVITGKSTKKPSLGSKVNRPYLHEIDKLISLRYKIVALIRNPIYSIGSWNSIKNKGLATHNVIGDEMFADWSEFDFETEDKYSRQVEIWKKYSTIIWNHREHMKIIRYEDLVSNPNNVLRDVCSFLGINKPNNLPKPRNMNKRNRYENIDKIEKALEEIDGAYELKSKFGY